MTNKADPQRKKDLARIHLLKKELGLTEENYRILLQGITGKDSSSTMDTKERWSVILEMTRLQGKGKNGRAVSLRPEHSERPEGESGAAGAGGQQSKGKNGRAVSLRPEHSERPEGESGAAGAGGQHSKGKNGRAVSPRPGQDGRPAPQTPESGKEPMLRKIGAMLHEAQRPWQYANAIANRMFGINLIQWCTPAQIRQIVIALEYDKKRRKA